MSNGVEVIVRGNKTAYNGMGKTPIFPMPVKEFVITLPATTVSNQFHLVEHPDRPNTAIDHLLHSIVKSATPELVTRTLLTTFTLLQTVLHNQSTIVHSREETISNIVTQKHRPTIAYTPSVKAEASTISPELLGSLDSSYVTNTLTTIYTYYNTFAGDSVPVVLTSMETVENVVTVPAYLRPMSHAPQPTELHSRLFETETYYSTFTFSKTIYDEASNSRVHTTLETLTQVVVTEALIPIQFHTPQLLTPTFIPTIAPSEMKKTYYTTFTTYLTNLEGTNFVTTTTSHVTSNIVTVTQTASLEIPILVSPTPTMMPVMETAGPEIDVKSITPVKLLKPVMIYATKTYYTTTTYLTSILGEGNQTKIHSRTQVVSNIVTEALSTALNADHLNALKSSYLAQHSTLLEVTSSIEEMIPTRTIEGTYYPEPSYINQFPHWPKDEDLGILDRETLTSQPPKVVEPSIIQQNYEEMKSEIHHIVNVLADSSSSDEISPSPTKSSQQVYATAEVDESTEDMVSTPSFDEELTTVPSSADDFETEKPISHIPTPPLKSADADKKYSMYFDDFDNTTPQNEEILQSVYINNKLVAKPMKSSSNTVILHNQLVKKKEKPTKVSVVKAKNTLMAFPEDKPISEAESNQQIFDLLSDLTSGELEQPDYYDEAKEEDAFKEHEDGSMSSKIYDLSADRKNTTQKLPIPIPANTTSTEFGYLEPDSAMMKPEPDEDDIPATTAAAMEDKAIPEIPSAETLPPTSSERVTIIKFSPNGSPNHTEIMIKLSTKVPSPTPETSTNSNPLTYTVTTKRPKVTKPTTPAPIEIPDEYEDSSEASTKIYNLFVRKPAGSSSNSAENTSGDVEVPADDQNDEKSEEESVEHSVRRPPGLFSSGSTGSSGGHSGPSKTSLVIPASGPSSNDATPQVISTHTGAGINWKPLLNLGAIGLGGLGASTLTKLTPLLSSMAGYLKSGFVPGIARNDTQQFHHFKNDRPYGMRYPQQEHGSYNEPNYMPVGNSAQNTQLFRQPEDSIPRHPVISHANEPNFRPIANNPPKQNPKPATGSHRFENGQERPFPPPNYNFKPPNDKHPNIFTQVSNGHGNKNNNAQQPSSNIVKVVAGNPINAMPVNRSPETRPQLVKKEMIPGQAQGQGQGDKRRPSFVRLPPRSQEAHGPWQQQIILPFPSDLDLDSEEAVPPRQNSKHRPEFPVQVQTGTAEIRPVNRPIGQIPRPLPGQGQHNNLVSMVRQPQNRFPTQHERPSPDQIPDNIQRPSEEVPSRFVPHPHPQPQWNQANNPFFSGMSKPGGADNPFNPAHQRPLQPFHHNPHQHQLIRDSSEEESRPITFIPPRPIPPNIPAQNQFNFRPTLPPKVGPVNSIRPQDFQEHFLVDFSSEELQAGLERPNQNQPQNGHKPPVLLPQKPGSHESNSEESILRPDHHPMIFRPPLQNNQPRPPFRHIPENNQGSFRPNIPGPFQPQPTQNQNIHQGPPQQQQLFGPGFNIEIEGPLNMPPFRPHGGLYEIIPSHSIHHSEEEMKPRPDQQRPGFQNNNQRPGPVQHNEIQRPGPAFQNDHQRPGPAFQNELQRPGPQHQNELQRPGPAFQSEIQRPGPPHQNELQRPGPPHQNEIQRPGPPHQNQNQRPGPPFQNEIQRPGPPFQNELQRPGPGFSDNVHEIERPSPGFSDEVHETQHSHHPVHLPGMRIPNNHKPGPPPQQRPPVLLPGSQELHWNQNTGPQQSSHEENSEERHPSHEIELFQQQGSNSYERPGGSFQQGPGPRPLPPMYKPTPHQSPYLERPSTVYFVHETYDPVPSPSENPTTTTTTTEPPETTPKKYPQLIIKEIPITVKTTTPKPTTVKFVPKPNFIRRFSTTVRPTRTPGTTPNPKVKNPEKKPNVNEHYFGLYPQGFDVSPTIGDIFGISKSPTPITEKTGLTLSNEILDGKEKPLSKFSGSLSTSVRPVNVDQYFPHDEDEETSFGQTFSGSEDSEAIIDPVNHLVIKSPFSPANTTSNIRTTESTQPNSEEEDAMLNAFKVPEAFFTGSTPKDFNLWWPTTFKPIPGSPQVSTEVMAATKDANFVSPTTFRNTVRPTTFRPRRPLLSSSSTTRDQLSRPPQTASSFYDEDEGLEDVKLKNIEIHKMPDFKRRPPLQSQPLKPNTHPVFALIHNSFEEDEDNENTPAQPKPSPPKLQPNTGAQRNPGQVPQPQRIPESNKNENTEQGLQDSKEYTDDLDETNETYELAPPGYPVTRLRPPPPPPRSQFSAVRNENQNRIRPFIRQPPPSPPDYSNRPGPIETLKNIFRRPTGPERRPEPPGHHGPPPHSQGPPVRQNQNQPPPPIRRPIPNNNQNQGFRQPPPNRPNPNAPPPNQRYPFRPDFSDSFNKVKPIPLNPAAAGETGSQSKPPQRPIHPDLIRRPSTSTSTSPPQADSDLSYEDEEDLPAQNDIIETEKKVTQGSNGLSLSTPIIPVTPVRDLTPAAADNDPYYEEEDTSQEEIIPNHEIQKQPTIPRPNHIGGHLMNVNTGRPQQRLPQRPLIPNPPKKGSFENSKEAIDSSSEFSRPTQSQAPPRTEMEPPPIDSHRLKPSVLELPSNGPIRFRPGRPQDGPFRPNLLRPEEHILKPEPIRPNPTFHTIASVDEDNKIVGTNLIPAVIPSRSSSSVTKPQINPTSVSKFTETIQSTRNPIIIGSVEPVDLELDASDEETPSLQGSSESSIVKYVGGTLKTESFHEKEATTRPSFTRTVTKIFQRSSTHRTRGEVTSSTSIHVNPTRASDIPLVLNTNSRPASTSRIPFPRPTLAPAAVTPEPGSSTPRPNARKPFIPIRNPNPSALPPWHRRTTTTGKPVSSIRFSTDFSTPKPRFTTERFSTTLRFSPTVRTRGTTLRLERPTTTEMSNLATEESQHPPVRPLSSPATVDTTIVGSESNDNSIFSPTTFRPANRPTHFKETSNSTTRVVTTPKFEVSTTEAEPIQTKEEESFEISENPTVLFTKNGTISVSKNVRISPTRVSQRGGTRRSQTVVVSTASNISTRLPIPAPTMSTRFVTHTETLTQTIRETETTVLAGSQGAEPMTHTVVITKTLPPQTLISTIVGTITLVNTVEITPTTVRSTIFSEPTKAIFAVTEQNTIAVPESNEPGDKVLHAGMRNNARRPVTKRPVTDSTTARESAEVLDKKSRPSLFETGCSKSNCSMQGNQICKTHGNTTISKCVCKPGYARMKFNSPCRPTFTYEMTMAVNNMEGMSFNFNDLKNEASDAYSNFASVTKEALDKAFLSTDIKRQFQGAEVMKVKPEMIKNEKLSSIDPRINVDFLVQLTVNMTEDRIKNHLIRTLKASNFSVGKTGVISSKNISDYAARDFDECSNPEFHDCSINADCINVRGSYACQCRVGFKDRSKKHKPGRDCNEMAGCSECNYRGNCYMDKYGNSSCDCFRWYGGAECQINLKVLLMTIIGVGAILFFLVLLCGILICRRNKRARERPGSGRFMRYRSPTSQATLERTAIMHDSGSSSSEGSQSPPTRNNHPSFTPDSLVDSPDKNARGTDNVNLMNFSLRNVVMDQDRSLTVVIPRAKIRPSSRPSSRPNPASGGVSLGHDTTADLATTERKLINYLDHGPYPVPTHKPSGNPVASTSQSTLQRNNEAKAFRKLSLQERRISTGALVSSGTEVSARGGMRRRSTGLEPELPLRGYDKTLSDMRSYDETTVRSHAKQMFASETSRASCYSCKPPSYCAYSESAGHTMAEKDGASTVYTTQGKLFRMSNDSDSNLSSD